MPIRDYFPTKREEGPYKGPLSIYSEWHATILGVVVGVASVAFGVEWLVPVALGAAFGARKVEASDRTKALNELRKEPWYFATGLLAGWFILGPLL